MPFSHSKQESMNKKKIPKVGKVSNPTMKETSSICITVCECVCAFMHAHVYTVHPCQRSAFRQVFELLHHLVLLLREHEFCFTLLSK